MLARRRQPPRRQLWNSVSVAFARRSRGDFAGTRRPERPPSTSVPAILAISAGRLGPSDGRSMSGRIDEAEQQMAARRAGSTPRSYSGRMRRLSATAARVSAARRGGEKQSGSFRVQPVRWAGVAEVWLGGREGRAGAAGRPALTSPGGPRADRPRRRRGCARAHSGDKAGQRHQDHGDRAVEGPASEWGHGSSGRTTSRPWSESVQRSYRGQRLHTCARAR